VSAYRGQPRHPLVVTAFRGVVIAVDTASGKEIWRADLGAFGAVRLHVDEHRVIALGRTKMRVLEYTSGDVIANLEAGGTTLLVDGDVAYVSADGVVIAVDLVAGEILWRNDLPGTGYGPAALGTPGNTVQGDVDTSLEASPAAPKARENG
jgi:outer membrane protein assembly factor BamB